MPQPMWGTPSQGKEQTEQQTGASTDSDSSSWTVIQSEFQQLRQAQEEALKRMELMEAVRVREAAH